MMKTQRHFTMLVLLLLTIPTLGSSGTPSSVFIDSSCEAVEKSRADLIAWNKRIAKAGVETFSQFPAATKTASGCQLDLNKFIPKTVSERSYPGFNAESETNCHGSTRYFSGFSPYLERALSFTPATYFRSICQEVLSSKDLKAGDIGIVQSRNTLWNGEVETEPDVHSFTYLGNGMVLQSPNMEVGKYPEVTSLQSPIHQYMIDIKQPELKSECQAPGADEGKCKSWIKYYRCDFAQPSCFGQMNNQEQKLSVSLDQLAEYNKPKCPTCEAENIRMQCSVRTKNYQIQRQKIREISARVRDMSTWEQLADVGLKPLDQEIMGTLRKIKDIEQVDDRMERKAIELAALELENLREEITSKVTELEKQGKPRPTSLGRDIERLSSGQSFSADHPKENRFSADLLTCLHLKLTKWDAKMPVQNCKQVFDSLGL